MTVIMLAGWLAEWLDDWTLSHDFQSHALINSFAFEWHQFSSNSGNLLFAFICSILVSSYSRWQFERKTTTTTVGWYFVVCKNFYNALQASSGIFRQTNIENVVWKNQRQRKRVKWQLKREKKIHDQIQMHIHSFNHSFIHLLKVVVVVVVLFLLLILLWRSWVVKFMWQKKHANISLSE